MWQQQCGCSSSVAAASVWRRQPGSIGVTVSAWRCDSSGRAAVVWHRQRTSSRGGPMWRERCGSSGVAAAAGGSSWAEPAGDDQSGGRACVRAGAQTWRAHLRGRQRGRSERASGRWRAFFEFTTIAFCIMVPSTHTCASRDPRGLPTSDVCPWPHMKPIINCNLHDCVAREHSHLDLMRFSIHPFRAPIDAPPAAVTPST